MKISKCVEYIWGNNHNVLHYPLIDRGASCGKSSQYRYSEESRNAIQTNLTIKLAEG